PLCERERRVHLTTALAAQHIVRNNAATDARTPWPHGYDLDAIRIEVTATHPSTHRLTCDRSTQRMHTIQRRRRRRCGIDRQWLAAGEGSTASLHDALPIFPLCERERRVHLTTALAAQHIVRNNAATDARTPWPHGYDLDAIRIEVTA